MFEITRRDPLLARSMRDLLGTITHDPFFSVADGDNDGNLALDVSQDDDAVIVRASLPGFDREDIDVQVHNGVLTITAEHTEESETNDERFYRRERRTGSVARRLALPGVVSEGKAKAELKDGVLTLRIPQAEEAKPKQIEIN